MKVAHYILILFGFTLLSWIAHPFFVSVTEIKYDEKNKSLQISCKMFTNDLENVLKKTTGKKIDLLHPINKKETETILFDYIKKHLEIKVNGKPVQLAMLGFENEEDAIWSYLECKTEKPKVIHVDVKLLYEYLKEQINIVHTEISGNKQSSKVTNPESLMGFEFK